MQGASVKIRRLLVFLLACLGTSLPALAQDCGEKVATFDLEQGAFGDIVIPISFGDAPVRMRLDFSSRNSVLYEKTAERLHLQPTVMGDRYKVTVSGERVTRFADIPVITIGKVKTPFKAFLVKQSQDESDGWFGIDMLAGLDTDIDFANKKVTLFSPNHCPAKQVVYWTDTFQSVPLTVRYWGSFDFPVQVDGHTIQMKFGSLMSTGLVRLPAAGDALGLKLETPGMLREPQPDLYSYPFKSLKVGNLELADPKLLVYWSPEPGCIADRCGGREALGYLSVNQFRSLHLYIAYREKKLYISVADPKASSTPTSTASPAAH